MLKQYKIEDSDDLCNTVWGKIYIYISVSIIGQISHEISAKNPASWISRSHNNEFSHRAHVDVFMFQSKKSNGAKQREKPEQAGLRVFGREKQRSKEHLVYL